MVLSSQERIRLNFEDKMQVKIDPVEWPPNLRPLCGDSVRHARGGVRPGHPQVARQPAHLRPAAVPHQGGDTGKGEWAFGCECEIFI